MKGKQEIAKVEQEQGIEVFGRMDYNEQINKAKKISEVVSDIIEKKKLYANIQGKKYVTCEGWTTMGSLLGLFPQIVEVREEKSDKGVKYIAVCEIRTLDGKLVSRAESECASWERNKGKMLEQGEYAIRSMAETRAVSKAYRICLSWIMTLAGYEPTPAEEIIIEQEPTEQVKIKKITILDSGEVITEKEEQVKVKQEKEKEVKKKKEQKSEQVVEDEKKLLLDEIRGYYKILLNKYEHKVIEAWLWFYDTRFEKLVDEDIEKVKKVRDLLKEEAEKIIKGGSND